MSRPEGTVYISPHTDEGIAKERLAVIRQLIELGYSVKVPSVEGGFFAKDAAKLGAHPLTIEWDNPISHEWIRDRMVHLQGMTIIGRAMPPQGRKGQKTPLTIEGKTIHSIGPAVGGECIEIAKNVFLVSRESFNIYPGMRKHLHALEKKYGVQFVPANSKLSGHMDFEINSIPALKLVLATREFLESNPHLNKLFRQLKFKVECTPEAESGALNFLKLGPKKLLIARDAPKTGELIREHGGIAIPAATSLENNLRRAGGIRCFSQKSNSLYRKVHGHR